MWHIPNLTIFLSFCTHQISSCTNSKIIFPENTHLILDQNLQKSMMEFRKKFNECRNKHPEADQP